PQHKPLTFSLSRTCNRRHLPSSPTRRSSDLARNPVSRRRTLSSDRASQDPAGRGPRDHGRTHRRHHRAHARGHGSLRPGRTVGTAARSRARVRSGQGRRVLGRARRRRGVPRARQQGQLMAAAANRRIRKAAFPVAGLGTRFLPATKTVPKEMLPIIDKPLIQYAVDEAIEAGCDTLVFITNRYKHAVADYFDKAYELEQKLERAGKTELLELVRNVLPPGVRAIFVTQHEAL